MATEPSEFSMDDYKDIVETFLTKGGTLADIRGLSAEDMDVIYSMAFNLYNHGKYKDAEDVFKFLCFMDHMERKFLMGLAACRQMQKNYEGAVQAYSLAAVYDIEDPKAHLHAGDCFLALERYAEAESALAAAIHWAGDKPENKESKDRAQSLLDLLQRKPNEEEKQGV
ncbi:SycD/LcrH family type III secretion system chaperone [Acanthopleuribacter pedis]|uniref:SycD/LcrH family type III secretion system chaperone n=1 Tax=Acanthopleuribacter pedis TaxID=442870 RepID=A0A8J7Q8Q0_9BACT|nr:SycD/LcrH family type III secretion system chaperone [Acanthopleuribacter pedis]MBO1322582.1 SycD/LcrH family type III secretion system chaperone [Acanthopleuribacter pedis]